MTTARTKTTRPAPDPSAKSIVVTCTGRKATRLPVKVTVLPVADFDASAGVFVDVSYTPDVVADETTTEPTKRKVRAYRLATSSTLRTGSTRSFNAVIKLPEQSEDARPWYVRARFKGSEADIRSAWTKVG